MAQASRRPAIALFARTPTRGRVKTRLQPFLTPDQVLALHIACIEDLCDKLATLRDRFKIYVFESGSGKLPGCCQRYSIRRQTSGDLGKRMKAATADLFKAGHDAVVLLGTDLPHLDVALLPRAVECLRGCDVVIGPALDGGYYLLALRRLDEELFATSPGVQPKFLLRQYEGCGAGKCLSRCSKRILTWIEPTTCAAS